MSAPYLPSEAHHLARAWQCLQSWCLIDPDHCARPYQESWLEVDLHLHSSVCVYGSGPDPSRGITNSTECGPYLPKLSYSYETCGELDALSNQNAIRELAETRTLRLSFPADFTWRVYSVNKTEGPDGGVYGSGRRGLYPEFVLNELTNHGPLPQPIPCRRSTAGGVIFCAS